MSSRDPAQVRFGLILVGLGILVSGSSAVVLTIAGFGQVTLHGSKTVTTVIGIPLGLAFGAAGALVVHRVRLRRFRAGRPYSLTEILKDKEGRH